MPTMSRHSTIAQDIADFIEANWAEKPANMEIVRARSFEKAVKQIDDGASSFIVVIVPEAPAEFGSRGTDECTVPLFVCLIASVPALVEADIDAWDLASEQVSDVLRSRQLKVLAISDTLQATRQGTVSIPTAADADFLYEAEVFFSVIEMQYRFSLPVPEVVV